MNMFRPVQTKAPGMHFYICDHLHDRSKLFQDRFRDLGGLGLATEIGAQVLALAQDGVDGGVDLVGRLGVAEVGEQERC